MVAGFTETDVPDQTGKVAVVTGANTGIGFHVARVLAKKGARVLLGCRSRKKAEAAMAAIITEAPGADVSFLALDLGDLGSIRRAAEEVAGEISLDLLINNAGIMWPPRELTNDGFESQFGVNHLGPFALTALLLDKLGGTPGARVISTSSTAHRVGDIVFDDINAEETYNKTGRYGMSKLANLLFAYELQRRLDAKGAGTISVACHPGVADSELSRHLPRIFFWIGPILRGFFNTSAEGAWPTLMAATAPNVEGGQYFGPSRRGETAGPATLVQSTAKSHDLEIARNLWQLSTTLTGINPGV